MDTDRQIAPKRLRIEIRDICKKIWVSGKPQIPVEFLRSSLTNLLKIEWICVVGSLTLLMLACDWAATSAFRTKSIRLLTLLEELQQEEHVCSVHLSGSKRLDQSPDLYFFIFFFYFFQWSQRAIGSLCGGNIRIVLEVNTSMMALANTLPRLNETHQFQSRVQNHWIRKLSQLLNNLHHGYPNDTSWWNVMYTICHSIKWHCCQEWH